MNFDESTRNRITRIIEEGSNVLREIEDLRSGLNETLKALGEEIDIKPALLRKAIRTAFKEDLGDQQETLELVEQILRFNSKL